MTTLKWLLHYDGRLLPLSSVAPPTPQWVAGGGRPAAAAPPILPLLLLHPLIPIVSTHTSDGPNSKFFLNVSIPLGLLYVDGCFRNSPKGKSQSAQVAMSHQKHDRGQQNLPGASEDPAEVFTQM